MTTTADWESLVARSARLPDVSAFLVERPDRRRQDPPVIGVPLRLETTTILATEILSRTRDCLRHVAGLRVVDYSPGHRPEPGEIIGMPIADVDGLSALQTAIRSEAIDTFRAQVLPSRIALYGVSLGQGANAVMCVQRFARRQLLNKSKWLYVLNRDGVYDEITEDDGFVFDFNFDLFVAREGVFSLNNDVLEKILGYDEQLKVHARERAEAITGQLTLTNPDDFVGACMRDPRFARKAAAIVSRPSFRQMSLEHIREHAGRFGVRLTFSDAGYIVFSNATEERWLLLKLLDDDFLHSELTDTRYEVNSKLARR